MTLYFILQNYMETIEICYALGTDILVHYSLKKVHYILCNCHTLVQHLLISTPFLIYDYDYIPSLLKFAVSNVKKNEATWLTLIENSVLSCSCIVAKMDNRESKVRYKMLTIVNKGIYIYPTGMGTIRYTHVHIHSIWWYG